MDSSSLSAEFIARFRSPEGAEKFLNAYNTTLGLWSVPYETMHVETSFGTTHINVVGSADAPPLLLIHGAQISSPIWYPNVKSLSHHFRVYAVDVIDQMGLSMPNRKLKTEQDCADWLSELLDTLQIDRVTMVGHSHGGWQTLNFAIKYPHRIDRMILLSPGASFARVNPMLLFRMLPVLLRPTPRMFYWSFRNSTIIPMDKDNPHPIVEQFMIGALSFKPDELSFGVVTKFKDDELRQVNIPTLLLIGEQENIYTAKPSKVIQRAQKLMPHIEAELIPNSKHLFPISQADITNERMLKFLTSNL